MSGESFQIRNNYFVQISFACCYWTRSLDLSPLFNL